MQSSHRIFASSSSISRTRQNTTEACKVSCCPRLSDYRTNGTATKILDIPILPHHASFSSHVSSSSPYSRSFFHSKLSSSAPRFPSLKLGLTPTMPNSGKRKGASREIDISKNLSYLLRHGAESEGIELDEGGWASVADVVGFSYLFLSLFFFFRAEYEAWLKDLSYISPMCLHRSRREHLTESCCLLRWFPLMYCHEKAFGNRILGVLLLHARHLSSYFKTFTTFPSAIAMQTFVSTISIASSPRTPN